jgi:hypothetical protein
MWALTVLGDACVASIEPLAKNPRTPSKVRGPAIEYLAMVKHPDAISVATEAAQHGELAQFARRALIIAGAL